MILNMSPHPRAAALFMAITSLLPVACEKFRASPAASSSDAGPVSAGSPVGGPPVASSLLSPEAPSADPDLPVPPDEPPPLYTDETNRRPPSTAEPQRVTLARIEDDRTLLLQRALVQSHFGGKIPSPLEIQRAPLGGDHRAVLLTGGPKERRPLILVLEKKGGVLWTKERPLAGIAPGVSEIVLLPGPDAEVRIAWFDPPTRLVAMRAWDRDGGILADFQLFEVETCSALSGLYWPGRGFLVIAAQPGGSARGNLLDERGRLIFGAGGKALPWVSRAGAPASIALDTDSSAIVLQVGDIEAKERALAARLDGLGALLWPRPLDLGAAPGSGRRIQAARAGEGSVRVTLPPGSERRTLEITSDGVVSAPIYKTRGK